MYSFTEKLMVNIEMVQARVRTHDPLQEKRYGQTITYYDFICSFSFLGFLISRRLDNITALLTLEAAARNSEVVLQKNRPFKFFSQECCVLPTYFVEFALDDELK